ncbi:hypothetical protein [Nitrosomonas marina]|uniref:Uncharacterized protein n=1 Tax=Nitrosomonas marina TaxID=917 RepID=A0A1H8J7A4_9PROT|nr:hypothetical protein [Nitrosomonas marina]SEN76632.1 hypothetical protein SAMN05216325_1592 [Nitrosomonas marina]
MYIYLIGIIAFLVSIGGSWIGGIDHGKKLEKAAWLEMYAEQREELAKELGDAMERVAKQNEQNEINLLRAINEKDETLNQLNSDLADARRVQFRTKSTACNENAMRGQAESAMVSVKPASKPRVRVTQGVYQDVQDIRVSESELSDKLWKLYRERETLKAYFKAVKHELEGIVEVVE